MLRAYAIAGAIALAAWCVLSPAAASAAGDGCARAAATAAPTTLQQSSHAVLCLVNTKRATRGMRPLGTSRLLSRAARRHSRDMVARSYFSHVSPNGMDARQRIVRTGYLYRRPGAMVGETIAWAAAGDATPAELVGSFMRSGAHRSMLLDRSFRQIGVGLALGAPVAGMGGGATLTLTFGRR
jgi:uncharacterized protein YkwD